MTLPAPTVSQSTLMRFESELKQALRFHEARLREDPEFDDISVAIRRRSEEARDEITAALARIDDGSYGICQSCARPIAPDRLEAMPHTGHCLGCAGRRHGSTSRR